MCKKEKIKIANNKPVCEIIGDKTGRKFELTKYMYGCLDPNPDAKLSSVSITGNSMSIDIWTGCAFQCAYCHVQGVFEDLNSTDQKMRYIPIRRTKFSIDEILNELALHPLFEANTGIISIGTSSTEPFVQGEVLESTLQIMEWFVNRGLKNPFWIVTKAGIPKGAVERLKNISLTNPIIISLCWANNEQEVEPMKNNRFKNIELFRKCPNIHFNWYLRPLVRDWSNDFKDLESMFKKVSSEYSDDITSIIPGGLRWTEGIEYGMTEVRDMTLPNNVSSASRHTKTLTETDFQYIEKLSEKYFGRNMPVYKHSACAISNLLEINNIALTNFFKRKDRECSICPKEQRTRCVKSNKLDLAKINKILVDKGIGIQILEFSPENGQEPIVTQPDYKKFAPAIKQQLISIISRNLYGEGV
ncbi:hypothetical protein IGL98_003357 [Enterococcus sp. DIV0840]|uniref:hypothetical protein n=1 Tax=unclassified Enterococcus TaxID=2608891 RepID=UPI001A8D8415|nr:hypothetical protein [Enterococcus sp. DIV0849a]MBO0433103.1 hypothetical protein [Enterococcus sp. DIV0849a]